MNMDCGNDYPPSQPSLCQNGCGFFGTAATKGLCSKCYRDLRAEEERGALARSTMEKLTMMPVADLTVKINSSSSIGSADCGIAAPPPAANRCWSCKKKVGVLGFNCRCGFTFCGRHRYPEKHDCTYDFRGQGRDAIAEANPVIKPDKIQRF